MAAYLILGGQLYFPVASCASEAPNSEQELQHALEVALNGRDTNAVLSLFNGEGKSGEWKESPIFRKATIKAQTAALLGMKRPTVQRSALPKDFLSVRLEEANGVSQSWNVEVSGVFRISDAEPSKNVTLPYGVKAGRFYLAAPIAERLHGIPLNVRVMAGPDADSMTFTGSWVYLRDGSEVVINVSNATNRFKTCWGEYIKSCSIQRTNIKPDPKFDSWFHYEVNENGTNVFESPEITNDVPVVYRRK